jgi:hypothetical protein
MRSVSTIEATVWPPSDEAVEDSAAREARLWLTRRLRWERRLTELRAAYERVGTVAT